MLFRSELEGARKVAEQIRSRIETASILGPDGIPVRVTISIGIASTAIAAASSAGQLMEFADQALYQAKAAGRNVVICYGVP